MGKRKSKCFLIRFCKGFHGSQYLSFCFFEIVNICRFFTDDLEGDKIEGSLLEGRRRFTVFF